MEKELAAFKEAWSAFDKAFGTVMHDGNNFIGNGVTIAAIRERGDAEESDMEWMGNFYVKNCPKFRDKLTEAQKAFFALAHSRRNLIRAAEKSRQP